MLGKRIDRAAAGVLCAAGYYLFFLNAWGSIPLACGAAFVACILTRHLVRAFPRRRRISRSRAMAELLRLAALPDGEAEAALTALVRRRYPGEDFRLASVLKHPEATASSGDILNAWKANRNAGRLVVAATCPCEPRAALFARELKSPDVAVIDSRGLIRMLRALSSDDMPAAPEVSIRHKLRWFGAAIASARVSPRNALLAVGLLATYLFSGNPFCLFSALALLTHLGMAMIHRRVRRRQLFENAG